MPAKMTTVDFVKKAKLIHVEKYDYSDTVYSGNALQVTIVCPTHGAFSQRANDHLSKKAGCPKCAGVKKLSIDEFLQRSQEAHKGKYTYKNVVYKNVESKVQITCLVHGDFLQTTRTHMNGHGCPKCAGLAPSNTDEFIEKAKAVHGELYEYSLVDYTTNHRKVTLVCREHGEFKQAPAAHLSGNGCPVCGGVKPMHTKDFIRKAVEIHGGKYTYENSEYTKKTNDIIITCPTHGDFPQLPFNHLSARGCPKCACNNVSKVEDLLKDKLLPFVSERDKSILNGRELDLYFAEHKVAVEVNGLFWHSEDKGKGQEFHISKTMDCQTNGVKLLHFTEAEVYCKTDTVVSMIRNALGVSQKIHARKCCVREVPFSEYSKFFLDNHISGNVTSKIAFGLYAGDELLTCMSFNTPRFNKKFEWEIIRFATKLGFSVVGGASKLLSHFIRSAKPHSILSYANLKYGDGKVYDMLEFVYSHTTKPGYSYHHKNGIVVGRIQAQKHKLPELLGDKFDPNKTEKENMLGCGYHKIFDCGHKVYTWLGAPIYT